MTGGGWRTDNSRRVFTESCMDNVDNRGAGDWQIAAHYTPHQE
jgi:hypothetical protein